MSGVLLIGNMHCITSIKVLVKSPVNMPFRIGCLASIAIKYCEDIMPKGVSIRKLRTECSKLRCAKSKIKVFENHCELCEKFIPIYFELITVSVKVSKQVKAINNPTPTSDAILLIFFIFVVFLQAVKTTGVAIPKTPKAIATQNVESVINLNISFYNNILSNLTNFCNVKRKKSSN